MRLCCQHLKVPGCAECGIWLPTWGHSGQSGGEAVWQQRIGKSKLEIVNKLRLVTLKDWAWLHLLQWHCEKLFD